MSHVKTTCISLSIKWFVLKYPQPNYVKNWCVALSRLMIRKLLYWAGFSVMILQTFEMRCQLFNPYNEVNDGKKELVEQKHGVDRKRVVPACFKDPFSKTVKSKKYTRSIKLHFSRGLGNLLV
ncbi:hypothetical protein RJT34_19992 [Clitoria ternatea]|uniref:Uncharacterized protein n=1 Tax=Clitoria ternatea TaxID=43366 RepID=A0AAN9P4D2_CLITE